MTFEGRVRAALRLCLNCAILLIMSDKKARYITTTLPYVNDDPHIGHALEFIQADALARYWRLMGHEVFFNTGTDEHGQKILQKANEAKQDVQEYVDHFAARFKKLNQEVFGLSFDAFIRTTDLAHTLAAQAMWKRCQEQGDIYKKKYKGLYCVGCERFIKESDLVDGMCPDHKKPPVEIEEENYFFALSKYQGYLEEYLSTNGVVEPEWRRLEALKFVQGGLEDFSISREKKRMSWGISVPGDDTQVIYVWFDALTNYISTLGWPEDKDGNFKKFWVDGETLQVAGKDQVRFQSIMWQAMLKSAGLPATQKIFYHGFINSGGQKMSKTIGNVISPFDMVLRYGLEATRYILLRHVHPTDDSDITWKKMDEWYTANLVNGLGNLVARVMKMAEDNEVQTLHYQDNELHPREILTAMDSFEFHEAINFIWSHVQRIDQKITEEEPFKVVKTDRAKGLIMIQHYVAELMLVAKALVPFMPNTAAIVQEAVLANKKPENLFKRLDA